MQQHGTQQNPAVRRNVEQLLAGASSFQYLDPGTQQALTDALTSITGYLANDAPPGALQASPLATQLAPPDLQRRLSPGSGNAPGGPATTPGAPPAGTPATGPTGRVGEVARATLNAINFPEFVSSLIQGTFQAIVTASIQQMEAYADLLKNVAMTVDRFMADNISDGTARDFLADQHDGFLQREPDSGRMRLRVNPNRRGGEMPSFFQDLGFTSPEEIDDDVMEERVVPAARRKLAEQRQQTLATMVLMGINRIVVDEGEIQAKLVFHIDASETTNLRFDQTKTTGGNMAGRAGYNAFTANGIMVNTASLNAQSAINVRADLTKQVRVKFRSETFPLERFADSAAIQLINNNAKVPELMPAPTAAPAQTPAPAPPAPPPANAPPAAPRNTPAAQSLGADGRDPWTPIDY
jgi:hypothetical protein